jgi:hypothetical protein
MIVPSAPSTFPAGRVTLVSRRPTRCVRAVVAVRLRSQVARTGPLSAQKIVWVHELAESQGETSTADTAAEAIPEVLQADDPLVEIVLPGRREPFPIPAGRGAAARQAVEGLLDAPERDAHRLGGADERHPPQYLPGEAPLVPSGSAAVDEALGLVEVEGRDGDTTTGRGLSHGQLGGQERGSGHSLDLNLT